MHSLQVSPRHVAQLAVEQAVHVGEVRWKPVSQAEQVQTLPTTVVLPEEHPVKGHWLQVPESRVYPS